MFDTPAAAEGSGDTSLTPSSLLGLGQATKHQSAHQKRQISILKFIQHSSHVPTRTYCMPFYMSINIIRADKELTRTTKDLTISIILLSKPMQNIVLDIIMTMHEQVRHFHQQV